MKPQGFAKILPELHANIVGLAGGYRLGLDSLWMQDRAEQAQADDAAAQQPDFLAEVEEAEQQRRVAVIIEVEQQLEAGLTAAAESLAQKNIWGTISGVFDKFPNGGALKRDQFEQVLGADSARMLEKIGVQSIEVTNTKDGQHYKLAFDGEKTHVVKTAELTHAATIEFDIRKEADALKLDNIQGLKVKRVGGRFTATVDRLDLTQEDDGNTRIVGRGHWGIFRGSRTIIVDPDGKVLSDK